MAEQRNFRTHEENMKLKRIELETRNISEQTFEGRYTDLCCVRKRYWGLLIAARGVGREGSCTDINKQKQRYPLRG